MNNNNSVWRGWEPAVYLADFYSNIEPDEIATIAFLTEVAKKIPPNQKILEFGSGPTLHHVFPFTQGASEIHMADYLESNLEEISKWVHNEKESHNWDNFIAYTLKCEGKENPSAEDIEARKSEARSKITKCLQADAGKVDPLGGSARASYPVVISCYCAESATDNHQDFERYINNISSLIHPGGDFVLACLRNTTYYKVGSAVFPCANVNEDVVQKVLEVDFVPESILIEVKEVPFHKEHGYTSIVLAYATKRKHQNEQHN